MLNLLLIKIERQLEKIGEAITQIQKLDKNILLQSYNEISYWENIKGMGNRLIHEYWGTSIEMVYEVSLYELEEFGFKIHISATINNYKQVFDVVSELLEQEGAMYKYLSDFNKIYKNFSETESLAESGKFITIYPRNRENCIKLLEKIYQKLPCNLQGIYILSDRN